MVLQFTGRRRFKSFLESKREYVLSLPKTQSRSRQLTYLIVIGHGMDNEVTLRHVRSLIRNKRIVRRNHCSQSILAISWLLLEGTLGLGLSGDPLVELSLSILSNLIVPLDSESEGRTEASFPFETT